MATNEEPKEREVPTGAEGNQTGAGEGNPLVQFIRSMRDFKGGIAALKAVADTLKSSKPAASQTSSITNIANSTANNTSNNTTLSKEVIAAKERETAEMQKTVPSVPNPSMAAQTVKEVAEAAIKGSNALQKPEEVVDEKELPKGAGELTTKTPAPHPVAAAAKQQLVNSEESFEAQVKRLTGLPEAVPRDTKKSALADGARDFAAKHPIMAPENASAGNRSTPPAVPGTTRGATQAGQSTRPVPAKSEFMDNKPTMKSSTKPAGPEKDFPEADIPEPNSVDRTSRQQPGAPTRSFNTTASVTPEERRGMSEREIPTSRAATPRAVPAHPNRSGQSANQKPPTPVDSPIPAEWYVPGREQPARPKTELLDSPIPEEWAKPADKRAEPSNGRLPEAGHTSTPRDFPDRNIPTRLEASTRTNAPEAGAIVGDKQSSKQKEIKLTGELTLVSMNSEVIGRARANMNGNI